MPGNVALASPSLVMPFSLLKSYQRASHYDCNFNPHSDGSSTRGMLVGSGRNSWTLSKKLPAANMAALVSFYSSVNGPQIAFYFYDPFDAGFTYDATGVQTLGRYAVRFGSNLPVTGLLFRSETQFSLVEIL